jgi:hypothetical protein
MRPSIQIHSLLLAGALIVLAAVGALAQEAAQPAPASGALVLSPGVFGGASCYQGWPLVLELSLWRETSPDAGAAPAEPLNLTAKQGTWCEALVVTVKNDEGAVVKWPLHLVAQDGAKLTLAAGETAPVEWWLAPEETEALPEGSYTLSVSFDPKAVDGLPTGAAAPRADPCHVRIVKEPAMLDADLAASKLYRRAWYFIVRGDKAGVDAALAQLMAADPRSIGARRLQAMLAAREGRVEDGLKLINEALGIYAAKHPKACPPAGLLSLRDQLERQLPEQGAQP